MENMIQIEMWIYFFKEKKQFFQSIRLTKKSDQSFYQYFLRIHTVAFQLNRYIGRLLIIALINNFIPMLNPEQVSKGSPSRFQNGKQLNDYKQAVINLQSTLAKTIENRHHNDQLIIQTFIQLSPFFKDLHFHFSQDFGKNIVRRGKIYCIKGKRRIYEKGDQMFRIIMPLVGNFFKRYENRQFDEPVLSVQEKLEDYIQYAQPTLPLKKKNTSMERRMSMVLENTELKTYPVNFKQLDKIVPFQDEQPPFISGLEEESYSQSLYSSGEVWIFGITVQSLRSCLFDEYQHRITMKGIFFRKMECFNVLDNEQLKIFIEKIHLIELKKDQYVFREGDISQNLYLLIEGQAKAQRTVQLFKEDPNSLYRGANKSQAGRRTEKPLEFSYADFEGVYNYSPRKKRMELGILAPVTIFGQQQVAAGVPRQADVQVTSTKAKMFVFTLKDIEGAGNGTKVQVDVFMNELYDSITSKRITIRREGLSNSLQLQNRRKMNYFYIDPSVRESRSRSRTARQRINMSLLPAATSRPHSTVKPRYHNFNFNQFVNAPNKIGLPKFSFEESKIANLAHNSGEIQGQIQVSSRLFKQRKSNNHKINIANPLFDNNYYKKQRKQILRIQNKKRMMLIEVTGIPLKSKSRMLNSSMA